VAFLRIGLHYLHSDGVIVYSAWRAMAGQGRGHLAGEMYKCRYLHHKADTVQLPLNTHILHTVYGKL